MSDFAAARAKMVERQIAARGVADLRVLQAMREVPRELFVSPELATSAYEDRPLPIEADQTISQPYIVALMIEAARIGADDVVLEIGAGSGYAAAILSRIAARVYAIERLQELAELAKERLERLGYDNVTVRAGDGSGGWAEVAPFDAIIAAASGPDVPDVLVRQLKIGGRLVMPVGSAEDAQTLVQVTRTGDGSFSRVELCPVRFVPLVGVHGWQDH